MASVSRRDVGAWRNADRRRLDLIPSPVYATSPVGINDGGVVTGIYADMDYNEFLMNDILETKQEGRVLRVWLNCPDQSNSLTTELCRELVCTLERAEKDGNGGSVLLAGRGESFCTGMDLNELATGDVERVSRLQEILFTMGARLTKPLIGAVQGAALASGTGVVANCHVVIASENATFGLTGIRLGLWPFVLFHAVSAAVGERRAIAM